MAVRTHLYAPISYPEPDWSRSIFVLGDMHIDAYATDWLDPVLADLGTLPPPLAYLQIGDQTDNKANQDFATHDAQALAWLTQLNAERHVVLGNHDTLDNARTVAAWETAYNTARNEVVGIGDFLVIKIGPDAQQPDGITIQIPDATISWLDAQLAAATKPCVVCCHAPLANTAGGHRQTTVGSAWAVQVSSTLDDTPLRAVLGNHEAVLAYVSGHTHTAAYEPGFVSRPQVGSRVIAAPNCSSVYYAGHEPPQLGSDPLRNLVLTVPASGDRVEIRLRDHRISSWVGTSPSGTVTTVIAT